MDELVERLLITVQVVLLLVLLVLPVPVDQPVDLGDLRLAQAERWLAGAPLHAHGCIAGARMGTTFSLDSPWTMDSINVANRLSASAISGT